MRDEILSYHELCVREHTSQKGMYFGINPNYSIVLMSQQKNAPYHDIVHDDGITIEYEGHDVKKNETKKNPKLVDQKLATPKGTITQNGKFVRAVEEFKSGISKAEIVRVYEKLFPGTWSDKGFFKLKDYKFIKSGKRKVFRFILEEVEVDFENSKPHIKKLKPQSRLIPSGVKRAVWERDNGTCQYPGCGAKDNLHFDHDLPFSKGGSSITVDNVKILCARHNLQKSDKIQ